jgi:hypothetical protein
VQVYNNGVYYYMANMFDGRTGVDVHDACPPGENKGPRGSS